MPTVTFDKKRVLSMVGRMSDEELADRISMLGTDLESVGDEIVVEVFPNRTDMLSEEGFAHALANFVGKGSGYEDVDAKESDYVLDVDVKMSDVRPYTAACVATGLKLDDEALRALIQLQEKLHVSYLRKRAKGAIGIYPMERIEWPVRFTAQRAESIVFTPLDGEEMNARKMLEEHPAGKEYGKLLKGMPYFPVFRDENDMVLSVPPIINSEETGRVTTKTTDVFVEVSGFHLQTLERALSILAFSMKKLGAQIHEVTVRYPDGDRVTPKRDPQRIEVNLRSVNKLLGIDLSEEEFEKLLPRMGLGWDAETSEVLVPTFRTDMLHEIDVTEDVAIAYGYENFEAELPDVSTTAQEAPFETFKRKVAHLLCGFGYQETQTYHLVQAPLQKDVAKIDANIVTLANPMNREYDTMRATVLLSQLDVLSRNRSAAMPRNVFEIGRVFLAGGDTETGIVEHDELAVALEDDDASFTTAQQIVDAVLSRFGLSYEFMETATDVAWWHELFLEGRRAHVISQRHVIGEIGEVHPDVLRAMEIYHPVIGVRINIEEVFKLVGRQVR